ncbi:DUF6257 family protein [Streptomyces sp. NPDC007856]|uniref:DUF6257 family protein n=1 Tax=Streptomyces sp. NPDC007856 TaxID=3364781 RepID=UPI00367A38F7
MADDLKFSDFTTGEKVHIVALTARAAKRGMADDGSGNVDISDLQRRIERIENAALRRKNRK